MTQLPTKAAARVGRKIPATTRRRAENTKPDHARKPDEAPTKPKIEVKAEINSVTKRNTTKGTRGIDKTEKRKTPELTR